MPPKQFGVHCSRSIRAYDINILHWYHLPSWWGGPLLTVCKLSGGQPRSCEITTCTPFLWLTGMCTNVLAAPLEWVRANLCIYFRWDSHVKNQATSGVFNRFSTAAYSVFGRSPHMSYFDVCMKSWNVGSLQYIAVYMFSKYFFTARWETSCSTNMSDWAQNPHLQSSIHMWHLGKVTSGAINKLRVTSAYMVENMQPFCPSTNLWAHRQLQLPRNILAMCSV